MLSFFTHDHAFKTHVTFFLPCKTENAQAILFYNKSEWSPFMHSKNTPGNNNNNKSRKFTQKFLVLQAGILVPLNSTTYNYIFNQVI